MKPHDIITYEGNLNWLLDRTIVLARSGSHAYGMARPDSDFDIRGVCIPPMRYLTGFLNRFEQAIFDYPDPDRDKVDVAIMALGKWVKLAADANPNVLELVWTEEEDILWVQPGGGWHTLMERREMFLSKQCQHTYMGYAHSQAKRIRRHYHWLKNPPTAAPTRAEFGLLERTIIPKDQLAAAEEVIRKEIVSWDVDYTGLDRADVLALQSLIAKRFAHLEVEPDDEWKLHARSLGFSGNFIHLLDMEKVYNRKRREWKSYQTWLKERNPARAELERKFGYDTKHGAHLVRLARMAREILEGKGVLVKRPDAEELLSIRAGRWPYERLMEWFGDIEVEVAMAAKRSTLPKIPPRAKIDALLVEVVDDYMQMIAGHG